MDERLQFVARQLAGEPMAELCREFGISRKTGYKIFDRYQDCGAPLSDLRVWDPDLRRHHLIGRSENSSRIGRCVESRFPPFLLRTPHPMFIVTSQFSCSQVLRIRSQVERRFSAARQSRP